MILGYLVDADIYLGKATENSQREVKIGENVVLRHFIHFNFNKVEILFVSYSVFSFKELFNEEMGFNLKFKLYYK
jgi:hypothetical protein